MNNEKHEADLLSSLRSDINKVDREIIKLLAQRREISKEISKAKAEYEKPIRDQARETQLLDKLIALGTEHGLESSYLLKIFNEIIEDSVKTQQEYFYRTAYSDFDGKKIFRIAIQGIEGAYSYLASRKFFSNIESKLVFVNRHRFEEVIKTVETGEADFAVLPIENTTSGSINEVYDLLSHTTTNIIGEEIFRVKHCLVSVDDTPVEKVEKIFAHYQAAAQCSKFLSTLTNCHVEYFVDTAMSARKIKEENNPVYAAIASEEAAALFGLKIIKDKIANQEKNFTRFIVASRSKHEIDENIPAKTSLITATENKPGSLVNALAVFQKFGVNMTKLESRPVEGNPWEEMFYVDFEGNIHTANIKNLLAELEKCTRFVKILGCYPASLESSGSFV